jgi:enoyl-CoA hydratase
MTYKNILVERAKPAAIITLNRPKQLNALSHEMLQEVSEALDELDADSSIRAIIITGSGDRAFAAGADIGELQALESAEDGSRHSRDAHRIIFKIEELSKPVIVAVNGYALGGGCELAMGGDIILASEDASFGQPEVNLGIIPGFGGTQRLPRLVGRTKALELIFTGERISASEAERIGLVNRVVPQDQLLAVAQHMARTIAEKAPLAIAIAKRAVYEGLEQSPRAGNELEMRRFGEAVGTQDRREGTSAFLEKRRPDWKGK